MRKTIYDIIETGDNHINANKIYSGFMLICIVLSLVPLAFKDTNPVLEVIDDITVSIFILDYLLRLFTADYKYNKGFISFLRYPFSFMAIVDLLSILPSLNAINMAFKTLRVARISKLAKVLRAAKTVKVLKAARYSKSADILVNVIKKSKDTLVILCALAIGYICVTALIIFNVESQTFDSFFDALYWATISLTTVGYGDIYTVTTIGKIISMISSFVGIAIVALPSGIITAGFVNEINKGEEK